MTWWILFGVAITFLTLILGKATPESEQILSNQKL